MTVVMFYVISCTPAVWCAKQLLFLICICVFLCVCVSVCLSVREELKTTDFDAA